MTGMRSTAVLEVSGVQRATANNVAEAVLSRRPGVLAVEANPVAQTATVTYDPDQTSVAELAGWVSDCGYHCAGQSVPNHICDPLADAPTAHAGYSRSRTLRTAIFIWTRSFGCDYGAGLTEVRPNLRFITPPPIPQAAPSRRKLHMLATPLLGH